MSTVNGINTQIRGIINDISSVRFARDIGRKIIDQVISDINSGIDYNGQSFDPLSQSTITSKGHDQFLIDTGELLNSFGFTGLSRRVLIFNNADHASFINEGTKNMPQRQFFPTDNDDISDTFEGIMQKELDAVITKNNLQ